MESEDTYIDDFLLDVSNRAAMQEEAAEELRKLERWIEANHKSPILARLNAAVGRVYDGERSLSQGVIQLIDVHPVGPPQAFLEEITRQIEAIAGKVEALLDKDGEAITRND